MGKRRIGQIAKSQASSKKPDFSFVGQFGGFGLLYYEVTVVEQFGKLDIDLPN